MRREGGRRRMIGRLEMKDEVWYVCRYVSVRVSTQQSGL